MIRCEYREFFREMRWRLKSAEWGAIRDSAARRAHVDPAEDIHTSRSLRQDAAIRRRTSRDRRHRWCIKLSINFKSLPRWSLPERSQSAKFTPQPCQRSAGSFLGTKRSFLWTERSFLGTGLSFLWTERSFLGTALSFLWTRRSFLGTELSFLWTERSFLWIERSFLWTERSFLWTGPFLSWDRAVLSWNRAFLLGTELSFFGTGRSFLWTGRSFRSHDTPVVDSEVPAGRMNAEPMEKRRFTHRPCRSCCKALPGARNFSPPQKREAREKAKKLRPIWNRATIHPWREQTEALRSARCSSERGLRPARGARRPSSPSTGLQKDSRRDARGKR